jgi:hypothetical protein
MAFYRFLLLSDTKKAMLYVVQSRPKLDYTYFKLKLSCHFKNGVSQYLSSILVRDTLSSCVLDLRS